jgi:Purple acid Phosphatase, N-terminal domain
MSAHPGSGWSGTPEQVHLTWGDDPARAVVVSWASPGRADRPRVRIGQRVIAAERARDEPRGGTASWAYHALVDGLRPGATYGYAVTADNDANAADPFSATFTTAPEGRAAFRFTSLGDLAAPGTAWAGPDGQAAWAAGAVEAFQPLFHLNNADPGCAGLSSELSAGGVGADELSPAGLQVGRMRPAAGAQALRDFWNNIQESAANRPWLPVPGGALPGAPVSGGLEQGADSPLTRHTLPSNWANGSAGRWYAFRVGTAAFVSLNDDDAADRAPAASPAAHGYPGDAQTRWLEATLTAARSEESVDWIVVQLHRCGCSSAPTDLGSDWGIREEWLALFDTYEVDLVLCGHGDGYQRTFPVRGSGTLADAIAVAGTADGIRRPHAVTTADSHAVTTVDTSHGTVHLALGCGGVPGIAVFDVSPGAEAGGETYVTVRYYRAPALDPGGEYALFDTFTLVRSRSDGRRWHPRG